MGIGSGSVGSGAIGSFTKPDEFEELSEDEKDETYTELYEEIQEHRSDFEEYRTNNKRHRKYTWIWRISSFVVGNITGAVLTLLL